MSNGRRGGGGGGGSGIDGRARKDKGDNAAAKSNASAKKSVGKNIDNAGGGGARGESGSYNRAGQANDKERTTGLAPGKSSGKEVNTSDEESGGSVEPQSPSSGFRGKRKKNNRTRQLQNHQKSSSSGYGTDKQKKIRRARAQKEKVEKSSMLGFFTKKKNAKVNPSKF